MTNENYTPKHAKEETISQTNPPTTEIPSITQALNDQAEELIANQTVTDLEPGAPKTLKIVQLYPRDMNIYGDWGNTLSLARRAQAHGYAPQIIDYNPGDTFPQDADIILGGGGQDSGQIIIQEDLQALAKTLHTKAEEGTPMLLICGLYQLFGKEFRTVDGQTLQGIGIFDATTLGGEERLIGNIVQESEEFGTIIGFENHSGLTTLSGETKPLATVTKGQGNNTKDQTEGARKHNVIGTYLHGSLLPKNPKISDFLIQKAAENKYGTFTPAPIDDSLIEKARQQASNRPR